MRRSRLRSRNSAALSIEPSAPAWLRTKRPPHVAAVAHPFLLALHPVRLAIGFPLTVLIKAVGNQWRGLDLMALSFMDTPDEIASSDSISRAGRVPTGVDDCFVELTGAIYQ